ncbi:hypothetical protein B0H19DRAFT_581703 [Mycena capillaripes]|nr:hypothetical protein B0H19DRAFT_581703 [Mycena capillaripes]
MTQLCLNCGAQVALAPLTSNPPVVSSPDLTHLLTSNDPPRDSEIPLIRAIISDNQDRIRPLNVHISTLEAQIHDLSATLAQFVQRRDEALKRVRQHRDILSPVRRVPPELVCEIFTWTVSSNDAAGAAIMVVKTPPWYLGHISRSWRHTALSFGPLWSSITVGPFWPLSKESRLLSPVQAQLSRSSNAPLHIHWPNARHSVEVHLLDLILPHSSRWRSLCLHHRSSFDRRCVLDWLHPINGHLDQLVQLEVIDPRIMIPDVFSTAPNLREVILTNVDLADLSPSIIIPWHQITRYRGLYESERQFEILNDAQNLLECAIGFIDFDDHNYTITPRLPHLRRLSVEGMPEVLQNLITPLLEDLRTFSSTSFELSLVLPFVRQSSCTLKRLALMQCTICSELVIVLRDLPDLTHLILEHVSGTSPEQTSLFNAMSILENSAVCPNLTSLVYGYNYLTESPEAAFFTMANSRFRPNSGCPRRLSRLRLFGANTTPPSDTIVAQMKMLQDDGFDAAFLDKHQTEHLKKSVFVF